MDDLKTIIERIESDIADNIDSGMLPEALTAYVRAVPLGHTPVLDITLRVPWGVLVPRRYILERYRSSGVNLEQLNASTEESAKLPRYNPRATRVLEKIILIVRSVNYVRLDVHIQFDAQRGWRERNQIFRLIDAGERVLHVETVEN